METLRKHPVASVIGAFVLLIVIIAAANGNDKNTDSAVAETSPSISVDTTDSHCRATGVDDLYTGNGHVTFYVRLYNNGDAAGTANVTPVRYYSDGTDNRSAMDMVTSDEIMAGSTTWFRTPAFEYKAHSHSIVRCAVEVDGVETDIPMT